jgi:formylmethanofuran dehydrogenase subunit E
MSRRYVLPAQDNHRVWVLSCQEAEKEASKEATKSRIHPQSEEVMDEYEWKMVEEEGPNSARIYERWTYTYNRCHSMYSSWMAGRK